MTIKEAKTYFDAHPDEMACAFSLWQPEDVISEASGMLNIVDLTDSEIAYVLDRFHKKIVTQDQWMVLQHEIENVIAERK